MTLHVLMKIKNFCSLKVLRELKNILYTCRNVKFVSKLYKEILTLTSNEKNYKNRLKDLNRYSSETMYKLQIKYGKCPIYVIMELQNKRDHITIRVVKIQPLTTQVLSRTGANKSTHSLLVEMQNSIATLKDILKVFTKLKILLAYDNAPCYFSK